MYMATTTIDPSKTIAEIEELLSDAGVTRIQKEYDDGEVSGLYFEMNIQGQLVPFKMPARIEPVFHYLQKQRSPKTRSRDEYVARDEEQAVRVAWRQILRWLEAQLALIETGMVETHEVFMPYVQLPTGETVFERMNAIGMDALQKALPMKK